MLSLSAVHKGNSKLRCWQVLKRRPMAQMAEYRYSQRHGEIHLVNWTSSWVRECCICKARIAHKIKLENWKFIIFRKNLLCSNGTRSASIDSHWLVKQLMQSLQARTRLLFTSLLLLLLLLTLLLLFRLLLSPLLLLLLLTLALRQGKCMACEFMCSALVDNQSILLEQQSTLQMEQLWAVHKHILVLSGMSALNHLTGIARGHFRCVPEQSQANQVWSRCAVFALSLAPCLSWSGWSLSRTAEKYIKISTYKLVNKFLLLTTFCEHRILTGQSALRTQNSYNKNLSNQNLFNISFN